ncbi:DMT family transporter, partial [Ramlibacter sp.]|uniref:DMT family transporter n=1 Tax=Ramlibacter sp. TaxID=1917967 RepID=UPI00184FE69A
GVAPRTLASGSLLGAALVFALPGFAAWPDTPPGVRAWIAIVLAGSFCTAGTALMYFRLIERIGPARALSVTFVLPVFAALYGTVFLGEPLTLRTVLCGAIVVLGTALAVGVLDPARFTRRRAAPSPAVTSAVTPATSTARTPPETPPP